MTQNKPASNEGLINSGIDYVAGLAREVVGAPIDIIAKGLKGIVNIAREGIAAIIPIFPIKK